MDETLKILYDCFYTPPKLTALKQSIESDHQELIGRLEKPERKLVLRIIDNGSMIAELLSQGSFLCGFHLAYQLIGGLKEYENGRLAKDEKSSPNAHFVSQETD